MLACVRVACLSHARAHTGTEYHDSTCTHACHVRVQDSPIKTTNSHTTKGAVTNKKKQPHTHKKRVRAGAAGGSARESVRERHAQHNVVHVDQGYCVLVQPNTCTSTY